MEISTFIQQNLYSILAVVFGLLLFKNRILSKLYSLQTISVEEAFDSFKKKPAQTLFLDIRTNWELEDEARIRTSKTIPLSELSHRMEELRGSADGRKIILVCRSGSRSVAAGIRLKKAGFSDVVVMTGGINAWLRSDYPVTRPKRKPQRSYG